MLFAKLHGKIVEKFKTCTACAEAVGMNQATLSKSLTGARQWKGDEIVALCRVLGIPLEEAHLYFFM